VSEERDVTPRGEIEEEYIDRLAETWPEPREQMHIGGWDATYLLMNKLDIQSAETILDLCCGEGGTATWLAKTYGLKVFGIDILESAINTAMRRALEAGVSHLVSFKVADVFELPFPDSTFDVIYGQDPDGLAHKDRVDAFKECIRILQPKGKIGFQHWILHSGAPDDIIDHYEIVTSENYPYMRRLTVDDYVNDMKIAGFRDIVVERMGATYQKHTEAIRDITKKKGIALDNWNAMLLEIFKKGYEIGVRILARAP
jgi:ubiquinone/menaquinone biosynthesis C-methylase UbiE